MDFFIAMGLAIVGGSIFGWVVGYKIVKSKYGIMNVPTILHGGLAPAVITFIAIALIGLAFTQGIGLGIAAIIIGYIVNAIVGARINSKIDKRYKAYAQKAQADKY